VLGRRRVCNVYNIIIIMYRRRVPDASRHDDDNIIIARHTHTHTHTYTQCLYNNIIDIMRVFVYMCVTCVCVYNEIHDVVPISWFSVKSPRHGLRAQTQNGQCPVVDVV